MSQVRYGQASRERAGWVFGMTGPQLAVVVLSGVPELLALDAHRWLVLVVSVPLSGLVVALVVVPVRGRVAGRWFGDLVLFELGRVTGWSGFQSRVAAGEPVGGALLETGRPAVRLSSVTAAGLGGGPVGEQVSARDGNRLDDTGSDAVDGPSGSGEEAGW